MEQFWLENIYSLIRSFSDLEEQKKIWLGGSESTVSTYSEDCCMLFDDNDFDDFIKEWERKKYNKETLKEMIAFRNLLTQYNEKLLSENKHSDRDILRDPKWLTVVNQANIVIDVWNINNFL